MLSFIVPAQDEELWIGKCLDSIRSTMEKLSEPYEVIVGGWFIAFSLYDWVWACHEKFGRFKFKQRKADGKARYH